MYMTSTYVIVTGLVIAITLCIIAAIMLSKDSADGLAWGLLVGGVVSGVCGVAGWWWLRKKEAVESVFIEAQQLAQQANQAQQLAQQLAQQAVQDQQLAQQAVQQAAQRATNQQMFFESNQLSRPQPIQSPTPPGINSMGSAPPLEDPNPPVSQTLQSATPSMSIIDNPAEV
jgi:predicted lipid-binding transport protein (Tim44 family)